MIVTPRYVGVSSKYVRLLFNDGNGMLLVVAVAMKYSRIPCIREGAVTQFPLRLDLAHDRSQERGKRRAVEKVAWNYCRVEEYD